MKSDVKWRPGITFDAFFRGLLFEALLLVQYPNSSYGIIRVAKLLPTNRPHLVSGAGHFFAAGSIARPELDPAVQWDRFSVLSAAYWTSEPGSVMTA